MDRKDQNVLLKCLKNIWVKAGQKVNKNQIVFFQVHFLKAKLFFFILVQSIPVFYIAGHKMVASPRKDAVFSFGGYYDTYKSIMKFSCPDTKNGKLKCQWENLGSGWGGKNFTYNRYHAVAMAIPDDLARKLC